MAITLEKEDKGYSDYYRTLMQIHKIGRVSNGSENFKNRIG